jgi:hypothetical protein
MSSKTEIILTCDFCGKTMKNRDGNYRLDGWPSVTVECWKAPERPGNLVTRTHCDFCPDCVIKHGQASLLEAVAKKAQSNSDWL